MSLGASPDMVSWLSLDIVTVSADRECYLTVTPERNSAPGLFFLHIFERWLGLMFPLGRQSCVHILIWKDFNSPPLSARFNGFSPGIRLPL